MGAADFITGSADPPLLVLAAGYGEMLLGRPQRTAEVADQVQVALKGSALFGSAASMVCRPSEAFADGIEPVARLFASTVNGLRTVTRAPVGVVLPGLGTLGEAKDADDRVDDFVAAVTLLADVRPDVVVVMDTAFHDEKAVEAYDEAWSLLAHFGIQSVHVPSTVETAPGRRRMPDAVALAAAVALPGWARDGLALGVTVDATTDAGSLVGALDGRVPAFLISDGVWGPPTPITAARATAEHALAYALELHNANR